MKKKKKTPYKQTSQSPVGHRDTVLDVSRFTPARLEI